MAGEMSGVAKKVCEVQGHNIATLSPLNKEICTACGMSLEEIRGEKNASEQSNSKTS